MLSCAQFLDRLYDDDCRAALGGVTLLPEDVAAHRRECTACRGEWEAAAADLGMLPGALLEPPPAGLAVRLQNGLVPSMKKTAPAKVFDPAQALAWAALGAAAAMVVASMPSLPAALADTGAVTWSVVGASMAAAASVVRDALSEALG